MKGFAVIGLIAVLLAGCQVSEDAALVRKATAHVQYPRGSRIQYATVPAGTIYAPRAHMGSTNVVVLPTEGIVLFIDEQPKYDWAHLFQLVFVPKATGIPQDLFRGSAIPDFAFRQPDGVQVTNWTKR
jgi:hypothetical protein